MVGFMSIILSLNLFHIVTISEKSLSNSSSGIPSAKLLIIAPAFLRFVLIAKLISFLRSFSLIIYLDIPRKLSLFKIFAYLLFKKKPLWACTGLPSP